MKRFIVACSIAALLAGCKLPSGAGYFVSSGDGNITYRTRQLVFSLEATEQLKIVHDVAKRDVRATIDILCSTAASRGLIVDYLNGTNWTFDGPGQRLVDLCKALMKADRGRASLASALQDSANFNSSGRAKKCLRFFTSDLTASDLPAIHKREFNTVVPRAPGPNVPPGQVCGHGPGFTN